MMIKGHRPSLGILIDVEEVFFHCPKAFRRSRTWDPEAWRPTAARPYADVALALWRKGQPEDEVRGPLCRDRLQRGLYADPD